MSTLKGKLLRTFFFIIGVLSCTSIGLFLVHFIVVEKYKAISDNMVTEYALINTVSDLIVSYNSRYRNTSINEETENKRIEDTKQSMSENMTFLDNHIVDQTSRATYLGLKNTIADVTEEVDRGLAELSEGNVTGASAHYRAANKKYAFVKENGTKLISNELAYAQSIQEKIDKIYQTSSIVGIFGLVLTIGGSIIYAFRFSNRVATPLRKLATIAEEVAAGNMQIGLNQELLDQGDEIGRLSRSYSIMLTKLIKNISELDTSNKELQEISQAVTIKNAELEKLNEYMVNRELKMIELKKIVKEYQEKCSPAPQN